MRWILCLMMLFMISFASGCATVISGECLWAEPIRPSVRDALTIGTQRQILAHDKKASNFAIGNNFSASIERRHGSVTA